MLKICTSKLYLHKKEHGVGLKLAPLASHGVSLEFSKFYFYCTFTLPSIYGGDTDFPFVVVV